MENRQLWELIYNTWTAIVDQYDPVFDRYREQNWLDSWSLGLLFAALTFEPDAISAASLAMRGPYTADDAYRSRLAALAEREYLAEAVPGQYRMTAHGRSESDEVIQAAYQVMVQADPLPAKESRRLGELLEVLVQACMHTPPPPDTWSIDLSYRLMPTRDMRLPYIEQAISCLNGYRDDAHLAAWRPTGISPTALESLTLLWRGQAASLSELFERLANRGNPMSEYTRALEELRQQGYLVGPDDAPRLTAAGQAFRQRVEEDTDHYFFAPWGCLDQAARQELYRLLTRLADGLKPRQV